MHAWISIRVILLKHWHTHTELILGPVTRLPFTDFLFTRALTELWKCVCLWSTFLPPPHSLVCSRWLMVAGFQSVPSFLGLPLHREEEKKSSCASGNDRLSHIQQCSRPWYASAALWSMPRACSCWEPGCTMDEKLFIPIKTDFTFEDRDGE